MPTVKSRSQTFASILGLGWSLLTASCGGGLQLRTIKATQQRPSNVAVYFKVEQSSGDPLPGLTADRFRIYEDDQLVSPPEVVSHPQVDLVPNNDVFHVEELPNEATKGQERI